MPSIPACRTSASVRYRRPRLDDAAAVHELVDACRPLDLNSPYAYLLLCTHFADTCAVGEGESSLVGFVGGYLKPGDRSVLFIWQIAVSSRVRGQGVGTALLHELVDRPCCADVDSIETTVTPSNAPSRALFHAFAKARKATCVETALFGEKDFGTIRHEEERLLRIGPLTQTQREVAD